MKKRHTLAVSCLVSVAFLTMGIAIAANREQVFVKAEPCEHSGNHYAAKAANVDEHGHKEFWACCKCHEQWLEEPAVGTFVDADDSAMSGGMLPGHIAYIPSELEELAAEAVVRSYSPKSYFGEKGTYEFDIIAGTTDLIATNATVAAAYATLETDAVAHKANRAQVDEDFATYRATLLAQYQQFMVAQVTSCLQGIYGSINQGVLAADVVSNAYVEGGTPSYKTWVFLDPTAGGDNRWWIPAPYKGVSIISYANSVASSLTTMEAVEQKLDALMFDVARSSTQVILEVEMLHAMNANGHLTYNGDTSAKEWWFVWTYAANSGLQYVGCDESYDPSTCDNYRLCGGIFNPDHADAYKTATLPGLIALANWIIANQVDDMFKAA